jgi:capsular exopolysaccharide synthesis family protein
VKTLERLRTDWLLATEINKLEARLWRHARRESIRTVLFTSAVRGEGKSTTVAYLATSLGLFPNRRVLAIDFDFRVPSLNSHFGLKHPVGIERVLLGEVPWSEAVIKTELPSLHLAMPSPRGADPNLLLRTQELAQLLEALRGQYDLILLDSPALIPVSDTVMLMPLVDGVILTGMSGKTTRPQLRRAQQICEGMDARILGLVVGNVQEAAPEFLADEYDYYAYSVDGKVEKRKKGSSKKQR